jgi:phage terminase large subunit-like protein
MSYEQETEKFAGTSRHFVHYDEEPPMHIFNECNARLVDTGGSYWISMTPVEGLTWTYDKIYKPGQEKNGSIFVVEADMLDNPYISPEAAEAYLSGLDDDERKAREHGTYVQLGGLVYKNFHINTHVIPPVIPDKSWAWYVSLDHGYNNPTAVLWHAVSPDNQIITFSEIYEREWTIDKIAAAIKVKNKAFGKEPDFYVADPAISQRNGVTGTSIQTEYAMRGLYFALGNNDVDTGVAKVQMYLKVNPVTGKPFRQITENCTNFIGEMQRLRWKTFASKKMQFENNPQEKIHKKDDHACDSDRYFHSFLPDLTPQQVGEHEIVEAPRELHAGVPVYGSIDDVLAKMAYSQRNAVTTQWKTAASTDLGGLEYD